MLLNMLDYKGRIINFNPEYIVLIEEAEETRQLNYPGNESLYDVNLLGGKKFTITESCLNALLTPQMPQQEQQPEIKDNKQ